MKRRSNVLRSMIASAAILGTMALGLAAGTGTAVADPCPPECQFQPIDHIVIPDPPCECPDLTAQWRSLVDGVNEGIDRANILINANGVLVQPGVAGGFVLIGLN